VVTVVVTGASGFLGRAVGEALSRREGIRVRPVSRRPLADATQVESYKQTPHGDVLIHLAEAADRNKVTALGPQYEAEAAATVAELVKRSYARVIYGSSAVLSGDASIEPHVPDDPVYVTDAYTRIKRHGELAVLESSSGVVARLSNVYGAGMSPGNVMTTIFRQIPGSGPLVVMDTTPVRDFLWVEDAAEGLAKLAVAGAARGIFNLSTGVGTSIGATARLALEIAGESSREVVSSVPGPASAIVADYARTEQACGWRLRMRLREGIALLLSRAAVPHH